jgi:hypothetical protein
MCKTRWPFCFAIHVCFLILPNRRTRIWTYEAVLPGKRQEQHQEQVVEQLTASPWLDISVNVILPTRVKACYCEACAIS